jgi:hypothetical protein
MTPAHPMARAFLLAIATGVLAAWCGLCLGVGVFVRRRLRRFELHQERPGLWIGIVPTAYVLCLGVWPLSLIVGAWQLRDRTLARQGALTLLYGALLVAASLELWWERVLRWALR